MNAMQWDVADVSAVRSLEPEFTDDEVGRLLDQYREQRHRNPVTYAINGKTSGRLRRDLECIRGGASVSALAAADSWDAPVPLGMSRKLPAFPVAALPDWGAVMVQGVAEETQTPADLAGVVFLGSIAAAAGGRAKVEVQPGWIEPVNLFMAVAMDPGSRKSSVFRTMTAPILEAEQALQEAAGSDIREREAAFRLAEKNAERALDEAAKRQTEAGRKKYDEVARERAEEAKVDAMTASQAIDLIKIPPWPRLLADDATPEALVSLLTAHGGRIAVMSAEGDLFDIMSGRYTANGQAANLGVFLKGHAGDLLLTDRKGRAPERIEQPALTIVVCIQPQVLTDIAARPALRGRGLLARILYSLPPDIVGYRKISPDLMPEQVKDEYAGYLKALVLTLAEWTDPATLVLTPGAREILAAYQERIEPRLRAIEGDLSSIRDWASKLAGATVRIAALIHLSTYLKDGWGKPVEAGTMERAVQLGGYFTEHALSAFAQMGADPLVENAGTVLGWIQRTKTAEFTKRDLFDQIRGTTFQKAADLDEPLALLAEHGYLRLAETPATTKHGGRPSSPRYTVNPGALQ
jgi:replicative DNA helicase